MKPEKPKVQINHLFGKRKNVLNSHFDCSDQNCTQLMLKFFIGIDQIKFSGFSSISFCAGNTVAEVLFLIKASVLLATVLFYFLKR